MADIVLVRWPEERAEAARLVGDGVPVLYLIAAGSDLPTITTCTEDWVRVPGDDWELSARMLALQQRAAAHRMPPSIDDDGRLRYNGKVVRLDAGTVPLARLFVERMGDVVTDEELAGGPPATPAALRSQVRSLRSALRDAGLHLERSRSRGYALQPR